MPRNEQQPERIVVPVIAEEAHVEKRVIPRGGVRVTKSVEEVTERVDIALTKDDVDVERRAVNEVFDERPDARIEDGVTIVPVVEEIVQRRFLVREEVRITRRRTEGRAVADVPLKRERAAVTPITLGSTGAADAIDVVATEEAADVTKRQRVVEDIVLEKRTEQKTVPIHSALKKTDIRISEAGRNDMNPSYQSPRSSSPSASKVAVVENRISAAHGTAARARSFPTGVLLLLVVLAIALIALIAAIF